MRAEGAFDDWIHSEAATADRPFAELPAADLATALKRRDPPSPAVAPTSYSSVTRRSSSSGLKGLVRK